MTVFHRNSRVEAAPFESDAILFNPDTKQFVKLNQTTALIWHRLDGGATADDIATALCERFRGVQPEQAKEDTSAALQELMRLGLVNQS